MAYTSSTNLARRQNLINSLRQTPAGGYQRGPLGALAQGLNAYTAANQGSQIDQAQIENKRIDSADMATFLNTISPEYKAEEARNALTQNLYDKNNVPDAMRTPPMQQAQYQGSPKVEALRAKLAIDTALARSGVNSKYGNNPIPIRIPDDKNPGQTKLAYAQTSSSPNGKMRIVEPPPGTTFAEVQSMLNTGTAFVPTNRLSGGSINEDNNVDIGFGPGETPDERNEIKLAEGLGEQQSNKLYADYEKAKSSQTNIGKIDGLISHLNDSQVITGAGADMKLRLQKVINFFGGRSDKVSDTELANAMMGSEVFPLIKSLGIGAKGMDTPAERIFLREVLTGVVSLNKNTLIKMATFRKNIAEGAIENWNKQVREGSADRFFDFTGIPKDIIGDQFTRQEAAANDEANLSNTAESYPRPATLEEWEKLEVGTTFINKDGTTTRK
tara:strand:- start:2297 stop:3625 length:1329 start_codon:yes stop_codon:yes gene_type:complete